ncbi:unnamed protein product [Tilletia controversa]|nr:unnamed protein product [Tilletia controversa]
MLLWRCRPHQDAQDRASRNSETVNTALRELGALKKQRSSPSTRATHHNSDEQDSALHRDTKGSAYVGRLCYTDCFSIGVVLVLLIAMGVSVKMITGDQLAIAKETGRRLGLGDNMFGAKVLREGKVPAGLPYANLEQMVLESDGYKFALVKMLQGLGHLAAMTGDGANDAPALARANCGVAFEGATDAARSAADIVLTELGLSISITAGFFILTAAFKFSFPPFLCMMLACLNDGLLLLISKDRAEPSPKPDSWRLSEIFAYATAFGLYLTAQTVVFFAPIWKNNFFEDKFGLPSDKDIVNKGELRSAVHLQTPIASQALVVVS